MRHVLLTLPLLAVVSCSQSYHSPLLGLAFEPPRWARLIREQPGPAPAAYFYGGLEVHAVPGLALPVDTPVEELLAAAGLGAQGRPVSRKSGRLGVGVVGRYEFVDVAARTLVYYVPLEGRGVVLRLVVQEPAQEWMVEQLEASLETLRLRR
jgi:hypothetical protein